MNQIDSKSTDQIHSNVGHARTNTARHHDAGMALPLVLLLTSMVAVTVITLSSFAITSLRFGNVAEDRSDRLSAADAGMRYAIDQLKLRNAGCILDTQTAVLPGVQADFNGTTAEVTCERITNGFDGIQAFAAALTGDTLAPGQPMLTTQSGTTAKEFGGPMYMADIDYDPANPMSGDFGLGKDLLIKNGPLLYYDDSGTIPCQSKRQSDLPPQVIFEPELVFGPVCVTTPWQQLFDSPEVPDLTALPVRNGALSLLSAPLLGSYTDTPGGCRVFPPGRYTTPPDVQSKKVYFQTGNYLFDFPAGNSVFAIKQSTVTAGRINPLTTTANENANPNCNNQQTLLDPAPPGETGATFYWAGPSRMNIEANGAVEIHARLQGTSDYVALQALCNAGDPALTWCNPSGGGSFTPAKFSTLTAASTASTGFAFISTDAGNGKELVSHALLYSPQAQFEFGNVTNTAVQKMLGGMIVSKLVLKSSTSATNFEISVPTSPITAKIKLTSTAYKGAETSVQAVVEYRPYEADIDERIRVNSWRVCEFSGCNDSTPPVSCQTDSFWHGRFYNNTVTTHADVPGGSVVWEEDVSTLIHNWNGGSPQSGIVQENYFSARWTRTITFPSAGVYQFEVGSDDGQELFVNGVSVFRDWNEQNIASGTNTFNVPISNPCNVDLELHYYEKTGQAEVKISWFKVSP